jgi:hypothetical protein
MRHRLRSKFIKTLQVLLILTLGALSLHGIIVNQDLPFHELFFTLVGKNDMENVAVEGYPIEFIGINAQFVFIIPALFLLRISARSLFK